VCLAFYPQVGQKTIVSYDPPIEDVEGNMIIPWKSFKERLRPKKKEAEPIPPDTSAEQLLEIINQLQLKITFLENQSKKNDIGSEYSFVSTQTGASSSNSSILDDKFELTGYVTDVSGRTYQIVKTMRGKFKTLRSDGSTVYLSGSQRQRMRRDDSAY
jgi:hypothetical protein